MAYRCVNCRVRFDEPFYQHERQWHSETQDYEDYCREVCPICGGEDFREIWEDEDDEFI